MKFIVTALSAIGASVSDILSVVLPPYIIWELTQDAKGKKSLLKVINDTLRRGTYVAGDVNADGSFNVSDLVLLQRWLLATPDAELANWQAGDLCEDNRLDVFDLCLMRRMLVE